MNTVILCGDRTFSADRLSEVELYLETGLASDQLGWDTLSFSVWWEEDLTLLPAGTAVCLQQEGLPPFRFYAQQVEKCGRSRYAFSCVSAVGLLAQERHYGGVYSSVPAGTLARELCGEHEIAVDAALDDMTVSGFLPIASRRENLSQLLFAVGAVLRTGADGTPCIAPLARGEVYALRDAELYRGGTVRCSAPATEAEVTEYAFTPEQEPEELLFSGQLAPQALHSPKGAALTGTLVCLDAPHHTFSAVGAELLETGANYCVLGGTGSCTLSGFPYRETRVLLRRSREDAAAAESRIVTASDCTLVTLQNSWAVAGRMLGYYGAARTVQLGAVLGAARPGDCVRFRDPWDDETEGYLASMEITVGATVHRAELTVAAGFTPQTAGSSYNASQLLTGTGSWTVPTGVEVVHLYLIGGGAGGSPGTSGEPCNSHYVYAYGTALSIGSDGAPIGELTRRTENFSRVEGGSGGSGGSGGAGGAVTELTLPVQPGMVLHYACGTGGSAGTASLAPGAGTETTLTLEGVTYTSAGGRTVTGGVEDLYSDRVLGGRGTDGVSGGAGGYGGKLRIARSVPSAEAGPEDGSAGEDAGSFAGGAGAGQVLRTVSAGTLRPSAAGTCVEAASGGGGGGASGTAAGTAADGIHGGAGAPGGDALPARLGQGGGGGHGGGGGGGYGVRHVFLPPEAPSSTVTYLAEAAGREGQGGSGGAASAGGAGCVLLYYRNMGVYQVGTALHIAYGVTAEQQGTVLRIEA